MNLKTATPQELADVIHHTSETYRDGRWQSSCSACPLWVPRPSSDYPSAYSVSLLHRMEAEGWKKAG